MHINKTLPLALALTGVAAPALAVDQGENYLGGGFGMLSYDTDAEFQGEQLEFDPTALVWRAGHGVVDNFAVEGRLGFGLSDDSVTRPINGNAGTIEAEIDQFFGIYGVGYLPINDTFSVYGLAGITSGELTATGKVNGTTVAEESDDDTDFSYGVGAELGLTEDISGYAEWVSYFDEDDYDITGVTVGAKYSF